MKDLKDRIQDTRTQFEADILKWLERNPTKTYQQVGLVFGVTREYVNRLALKAGITRKEK